MHLASCLGTRLLCTTPIQSEIRYTGVHSSLAWAQGYYAPLQYRAKYAIQECIVALPGHKAHQYRAKYAIQECILALPGHKAHQYRAKYAIQECILALPGHKAHQYRAKYAIQALLTVVSSCVLGVSCVWEGGGSFGTLNSLNNTYRRYFRV